MRCEGQDFLAVGLVALVALAGCGGDDDTSSVSSERKAAVAEHYADIVYANYGTSIASAAKMSEAIDRFLAEPSDTPPEGARRPG